MWKGTGGCKTGQRHAGRFVWGERRGNGRNGEVCGDEGLHVPYGGRGEGMKGMMRDGICCVGGEERE